MRSSRIYLPRARARRVNHVRPELDGLKPSSFPLVLEQVPACWAVGWQRPRFAPRFRFRSTLAPGAIQYGPFSARKRFAELNDCDQLCVHRVIPISSIKAVIPVRPTGEKTNCAQLAQFVLNGVKSEPADVHQFAHVTLLWRYREQRSKELGPHLRK